MPRRAVCSLALLAAFIVVPTTPVAAADPAATVSISQLNRIATERVIERRPGDSASAIVDRVWRQIDKATGATKPWHGASKRLNARRRLAAELVRVGYVFNPDFVDLGGDFVIPHAGELSIGAAMRGQFETLFGPHGLPLRAPVRLNEPSESWIPGWVYLGVAVVREDSMARMFTLLDRACSADGADNLKMVVANEMANEILQRPANRATRFSRADSAAIQRATGNVRIDDRLEVEEFISDAASAAVSPCGWKIVLAHLLFAALSPEHDAHAVSAGFLLALIEAEEARLGVPNAKRLRAGLLAARAAPDRETATRKIADAFDALRESVVTQQFNRDVQTQFSQAAGTAVDVLLNP